MACHCGINVYNEEVFHKTSNQYHADKEIVEDKTDL